MSVRYKTSNGRKIDISALLDFGAYAILIKKTRANSSTLQTKLSKMEVTSFYLSQCWMIVKKNNPGYKVELYSKWSLLLTNTIPNCSTIMATIISRGTNSAKRESLMSSRLHMSSLNTIDYAINF